MKPYLKYAIITSAVIIIWTIVLYVSELDRTHAGQYLNWLNYPVMFLFIALAMREQKTLNGGYIDFGDAFKTGLLMMVVVAVIMSAFTYVYFTYINPDFIDFASEKARESMEERDLSDEEIEQGMEFMKIFMSPAAMTVMALFGNIIIGAIFSLILAFFMKKKPDTVQS
ncbi:MAG TPA: DUF4199 domain-containing protein [Chitinophagales bacterium]|nr:DUF4199 domain-containing protein [Chitinophagales bacterium]